VITPYFGVEQRALMSRMGVGVYNYLRIQSDNADNTFAAKDHYYVFRNWYASSRRDGGNSDCDGHAPAPWVV
jgi:hypothetical protein